MTQPKDWKDGYPIMNGSPDLIASVQYALDNLTDQSAAEEW